MRKLIGLLFLTATTAATSAKAQGIFIDRGDPSAVSTSAGFKAMPNKSMGGSLIVGWTYRGVFDVGADVTYFKYKGGDLKELTGISATPFLSWHVMRGEEEELPVSISLTLGVGRELFMGNTPVVAPEGWGLYLGPSVFRRFDLGARVAFVPEIFAGYELKVTRFYSDAKDRANGTWSAAADDGSGGYHSAMNHNLRALLKLNWAFKTGNSRVLAVPYGGFQGGLMAGLNLGAMF
jgi:hypothetical protein